MNYDLEAARLKKDWAENPRWNGIERGYSAEDVVRLRGSVHIEHTLARRGAEKLWKLVNEEPFSSLFVCEPCGSRIIHARAPAHSAA
jgi:isocitrate lyase